MRKSNFIKAKEFVQSLISHFTVSSKATHFGIITYSTNSRLEFDFANAKYHDIVELKKRVMEISYPGSWTRTDKALEMAATKLFTVAGGDRNDKPNILIVLTDALLHWSSFLPEEQRDTSATLPFNVYAITRSETRRKCC